MPKDIKEIEYKKRNKHGWMAFFIIVVHFSLVIVSILTEPEDPLKTGNIPEMYVASVFRQSWSMFAPCPTVENRIKVQYIFENDTTDWIDPIENVLATHQTFRFTHHGNIAVGYYNMLYWFKNELHELKVPANENIEFDSLAALRKSKGNRLLYNYLVGYANETFGHKPQKSNIDIAYRDVQSNDTTHYYFTNYQ